MLNIKYIKDNKEEVLKSLEMRGFSGIEIINKTIQLYDEWREIQTSLENIKADRNKITKDIQQHRKSDPAKADELIKHTQELGNKVKDLLEIANQRNDQIKLNLFEIPNTLNSIVPRGTSEDDNEVVRNILEPKKIINALDHVEILERNGYYSNEISAKLSGSRFSVYSGKVSKIKRALENYLLDLHSSSGYEEYSVPYIVTEETMRGTGQLPKFKEDLFKIENNNMYLIPTAEVPLTNIYANTIIEATELPIKLTALTPCFRSEAGSAGKDTRGIIRMHQFHKVELVKIVKQENSLDELYDLLSQAEKPLMELGLPYRVVKLCSQDTGFSANLTFDLEVWFPSQNKYREISSCSLFGDFQATRANIKYKENDTNIFAHTLNGSALAIDRLIAAIVENYQTPDGDFEIPDVIKKYYNG